MKEASGERREEALCSLMSRRNPNGVNQPKNYGKVCQGFIGNVLLLIRVFGSHRRDRYLS
jgi:hypothetical protein